MSGSIGSGNDPGMSAMSLSVATSHPRIGTAADVMMIATTRPRGPSFVRSSSRISTIVATPITRVGQWTLPMLKIRLNARATRFGPSASYPVKSSSWPRMMLTPTALMKPTITALDTKRRIDPSLRRPAASMTMPVTIESVHSALARVVGGVDDADVGHDDRHRTGCLHRHE